jgi:hypothetical protein
MALGELGRCDEAADWQRRVIESLPEAAPPEVKAGLEATLARYQQRPCRMPGE